MYNITQLYSRVFKSSIYSRSLMFFNPAHIGVINLSLSLLIAVILFIYRFVYPKKPISVIFILLVISIVPTWSLFRPGMFRSGDMLTHTAQLINFYSNLKDGILLPRWAGDLCGTYGCPVFAFEYILPYYIGSVIHFLGFSFLTSIKLVLGLSFVTSGLTMYIFVKEQFNKIAGFVAGIFYLFTPYHLIDLHFRGSVGEVLSFVFIPLIFMATKRLVELRKIRYFFLLSILIVLCLLSHSSTTIVITPSALGYGLVMWYLKPKRRLSDLFTLLFSIFYGFLLSMFYWLPAMSEVKYSWLSISWVGDFKPILEYIYSPVMYGFLFQGHHGEYRLIIGYFHLLFTIGAALFIVSGRITKSYRLLLMYFLLVFLLLFVLMLKIANPIWENISFLRTFIMAWRLLVPLAFITSFIAAAVVSQIKNKVLLVSLCFLVIVTTVLNWTNRAFVPLPKDPVAVETEIYTEYFKQDNPYYLKRYEERSIPEIKKQIISHPPQKQIEFLEGTGKTKIEKRTQTQHKYLVSVKDNAVLKENTYYFPGWKITANGKSIPINVEDERSFGIITFPLKKGVYELVVEFTQTPVVQLSRTISLAVLLTGLGYALFINQLIRRKLREKLTFLR